jgi:hypothetical protein
MNSLRLRVFASLLFPRSGLHGEPNVTDKLMPISLAFLLSFTVNLTSASLQAAEQTSEHSVVGLFSPDRVGDFHKTMADIPELHLVHLDYETARATFRYDLKALFPTMNLKKPPKDADIEQRLSRMLGDASNDTFSLKPDPQIPAGKLTKVEIAIGILDCKGCRYGAYLLVMKEEGVVRATVVDKLITAWIDPGKTNRAAIEAALKKGTVEVLETKK